MEDEYIPTVWEKREENGSIVSSLEEHEPNAGRLCARCHVQGVRLFNSNTTTYYCESCIVSMSGKHSPFYEEPQREQRELGEEPEQPKQHVGGAIGGRRK